MSKRINTTLTDAQWDVIVGAVALADCDWESQESGDPRFGRDRRTLQRAFKKLRDG